MTITHITSGGQLSLVPILQGQRDRYKQRVRELEREVEAAGAAAARAKAVGVWFGGRLVVCVVRPYPNSLDAWG